MTQVFGPVADLYDEVRPGYPDELTEVIRAYHGGRPAAVAEIGVDAATRNAAAYDAVAPGGTLVIFGHRYAYADPALSDAVRAALRTRDRPRYSARDDVAAAGLFTDVRAEQVHREVEVSGADVLKLVQTFSPFLRRSVEDRAAALRALTAVVHDARDRVVLDLRTTVVLARRESFKG